jgi:hypothetical protein
VSFGEHGVTFRWKDYRAKGRTRHKTMTLSADEFIRRFLLHVLPRGLHRIRHYGWMANATRVAKLARARELMQVKSVEVSREALQGQIAVPTSTWICRTCAAPMIVIGMIEQAHRPRAPPAQGTQ